MAQDSLGKAKVARLAGGKAWQGTQVAERQQRGTPMDYQKGKGLALVKHHGVPLQLSYHAGKVMPAALVAGYGLAQCCLVDP